jgi:hypothetical protein
MMHCHCCKQEIRIARKVKLRPWREFDPIRGDSDSAAYQSYCEDMTYRWAFICDACYWLLDNEIGAAEIPGFGYFNLAATSRRDRATVIDQAKYQQFQREQAGQMGIEE